MTDNYMYNFMISQSIITVIFLMVIIVIYSLAGFIYYWRNSHSDLYNEKVLTIKEMNKNTTSTVKVITYISIGAYVFLSIVGNISCLIYFLIQK